MSYVFAAMLTAAAIVASGPAAAAGEKAAGPKPKETHLLTTALAGVKGKEVNVMRFIAPPGFKTSRHMHPGQLFVYVVKGTVTIDVDGKPPRKLGPGEIFEEPPGEAMIGRNTSATNNAELIVFQIGDKGKPLSVDVK